MIPAARWKPGCSSTSALVSPCGPTAPQNSGSTLPLAPLVEAAVGVDADAGMLAEAARRADRVGATNIEWRRLRAEELPAGLGTFRAAWVHVHATTHRGADGDDPHPRPPWDHIDERVADYLGPVRRAGQGLLPAGTRSGEEDVMRRRVVRSHIN
ncbi:class I SAM-dependent methyltransferase [Solwaraspora sp. WMMD791]|uniref:class I SAM-dependent methyltransferase n=1 Tax=Solwaraspora sp. WMMD791 TaxID=3016086 RepID=UPI00249CA100|nr:class I SAM-dependent methyltransferase [Solwaraspora sp. WMMD791]WFE30882.1 class I SAM-dependent methyltransferase [Solwaraspora sp. WMMD791]